MKLNKLIVPVITLFALTACGGSNELVPGGGEEIKERDAAVEALASAGTASYKELGSDCSITISSSGFHYSMSATDYFDSLEVSTNAFSIQAGKEKKNGKDKFGITSSDIKLNASVKNLDLEWIPYLGSEEKKDVNLNLSSGKFSTFIVDNKAYVDFSNANLGEQLDDLFNTLFPEETNSGLVYTAIKTIKNNIVNTLKGLKVSFAINPADYIPAQINISESEKVNAETINTYVDQYLALAKEKGINVEFEDLIKVYNYKDGSVAAQIKIDQEILKKLDQEASAQLEGTENKFTVALAFSTNADKIINNISFKIDGESKMKAQEEGKKDLVTKVSGDFKIVMDYSKNNLEIPDEFGEEYTPGEKYIEDFKSIMALISSLSK